MDKKNKVVNDRFLAVRDVKALDSSFYNQRADLSLLKKNMTDAVIKNRIRRPTISVRQKIHHGTQN